MGWMPEDYNLSMLQFVILLSCQGYWYRPFPGRIKNKETISTIVLKLPKPLLQQHISGLIQLGLNFRIGCNKKLNNFCLINQFAWKTPQLNISWHTTPGHQEQGLDKPIEAWNVLFSSAK